MKKIIKLVVVISCTFLVSCSTLVSSVTQSFAQDLSAAILDNEDLDMVKAGAPAYLILLDGLVSKSPDDHFLLRQSAVLHSAYAGAFVDDSDRAKLLALKAKKLAMKAGCVSLKDACLIGTLRYQDLIVWLNRQDDSSIANLYTIASTWIGWIQCVCV